MRPLHFQHKNQKLNISTNKFSLSFWAAQNLAWECSHQLYVPFIERAATAAERRHPPGVNESRILPMHLLEKSTLLAKANTIMMETRRRKYLCRVSARVSPPHQHRYINSLRRRVCEIRTRRERDQIRVYVRCRVPIASNYLTGNDGVHIWANITGLVLREMGEIELSENMCVGEWVPPEGGRIEKGLAWGVKRQEPSLGERGQSTTLWAPRRTGGAQTSKHSNTKDLQMFWSIALFLDEIQKIIKSIYFLRLFLTVDKYTLKNKRLQEIFLKLVHCSGSAHLFSFFFN